MSMQSHAWAIGWSIWAKNRGLFLAMAAYLLVSSIAVRMLPVREYPVVARLWVMPAVVLLTALVGAFTMPETGPKSKPRHEGFPTRLFTLPVPTAALVGWPMLLGIATVVLTWFALVRLVLRPCGIDLPLLLPALALATTLAFFQAIAWAPFGHMLIRAPVVIVLAPAMVVAPIWAVESRGFRPVLYWMVLPCYLAAAYAVAVAGVARDRRGDLNAKLTKVIDWLADRARGRGRPFGSADRAQLWFEWRGSGYVYPCFATLLLLTTLIVATCVGNPDVAVAGFILAVIVFFMGFLAALIGGGFAKTHFQAREAGLSPFTLVRPMSSGGLVAAKLKTAALSGLAGWVVVALVVPPFFALMGYAGPLATLWGWLLPDRSMLKLLVIVPLGVAALLVWTWRGLVGGLTVGLTGRTWIGVVNFVVLYVAIWGAMLLGRWLQMHPEAHRPFLRALPWLLGLAVTIKGCAACWTLRAASRRGHISTRTLRGGLVFWLATAIGLFVLLWTLLPAAIRSVALVLPGVFLALPLVRLAAAPLALDLQRHR